MLTDADRAAYYANEFDMIVLIRNALRSVDQLPAESTASRMPDLYWRAAQCPVGEDPEATPYEPESDDPERMSDRREVRPTMNSSKTQSKPLDPDHLLKEYEKCLQMMWLEPATEPASERRRNVVRFFAQGMASNYWNTAQCPVGEDPEATQYDPEGDDPGRVTAETYLSDEEVVELYNRARRVLSLLQPLMDAMQNQIGNEMALRLEIERLEHIPDTHSYKADLMENKATLEGMLGETLASRPAVFRRFLRVFDGLPPGVRRLLKP